MDSLVFIGVLGVYCALMGRRNLTPDQFKLCLGRKYNRVKAKQGGTGANRHNVQTRQIDDSASTAEKLATTHGVSPRTVERAGAQAATIDSQAIPVNGYGETFNNSAAWVWVTESSCKFAV